MTHKITPYNTGKVLIGCRWQPKPPPMTRDEEIIQSLPLGYPIPSSLIARLGKTLFYMVLFLFFTSISIKGCTNA